MTPLASIKFPGLSGALILACLSLGCFDTTTTTNSGSAFTLTTLPTLSGPETMALASERGHWIDGEFTHWTPGQAWNGEWSDVPAHLLQDENGTPMGLFYFDKDEATDTHHILVEWLGSLPEVQSDCGLELRGSTENGDQSWSLWLGLGEEGLHLADGVPSPVAKSATTVNLSPLGDAFAANTHLIAEAALPATPGEFRWTVRGPSESGCGQLIQSNAVLVGESGTIGEAFWILDSTEGEPALASIEPPGNAANPILHLSGDFSHLEEMATQEVFFVIEGDTFPVEPIFATATDMWIPNLVQDGDDATLMLSEDASLTTLPLRSSGHSGALNRSTSQGLTLDGGWSNEDDEYADVTPVVSGDTTIWATRSTEALQFLLAATSACEGHLVSDYAFGARLPLSTSNEGNDEVSPEGLDVITSSGQRPDGSESDLLVEVSIPTALLSSQTEWVLHCDGVATSQIRIDARQGAIGIYPSSTAVVLDVGTLPWHTASQVLLVLDGVSFGDTIGKVDALAQGEEHPLQVHEWNAEKIIALMDLSIGQELESVSITLTSGETLHIPTGPQCGHLCEEVLP